MDKDMELLLSKLPIKVKDFFENSDIAKITEIRVRLNSNIMISFSGMYKEISDTYISREKLDNIFMNICEKSLSAYEEQISNGFITLSGGHRVGIAGKFVKLNSGKYFISEITSLNIRISHFPKIQFSENILDFKKGLLVIGKPHSGKTTFIRSICNSFENINYTVCDERNEIFHPCLKGDFIINLPKADAVIRAVRVLNPEIIICDEIGNSEETDSLLAVMHSGVKFICSVHAESLDELYMKKNILPLIENSVFDKFILLENNQDNYYIKEILNV